MFIQDIHLYHQLCGTDLNLEKQQYTIELPNPITGEAIPGILTTEGTKNNDKSYTYRMTQKTDNGKMSQVVTDKIKDTYKKMDDPSQNPPPVSYECSYLYTIDNKRVLKATQEKTVVSAASKAIEKLTVY